jgi:Zn-dependent peptidase ImmA (M78 family)/transcriptional regulator with XRE-family HTH domain
VDLTPAAVSQYESGLHRPSDVVAARLALTLGVPRNFLANTRDDTIPSAAFFRSLRSTPQRERDRAAAFSWLVAKAAAVLETQVRLPPPRLRLDLHIRPFASQAQIEAVATEARKEWGVQPGPVANVVRLIESLGGIAAIFGGANEKLSAFSQWHGSRALVIFCARDVDRGRQRFDAAHELAHLAIHPEPEGGNHSLEQQANDFASAFLMPAAEIADALPRGRVDWDSLFELQLVWGVSLQALLVRTHRLGAISDREYARGYRHLSRNGWRRNEPLRLGKPEEPEIFARAANLLEKKGVDLRELLAQVGLPQTLIADLGLQSTSEHSSEVRQLHSMPSA